MEKLEKKGKRVTIDLDEVITRSDGSKATMREFVKEMLYYNPNFYIEEGETWVLRRKKNVTT
jgi:N-acetyl-beta-hexosaminidase